MKYKYYLRDTTSPRNLEKSITFKKQRENLSGRGTIKGKKKLIPKPPCGKYSKLETIPPVSPSRW